MVLNSRETILSPVYGHGTVAVIVRRLSEGIATGVLAPGERLPTEMELAALFGVAPMTLREALSALRELNLVETHRGRYGGSYVREDIAERLTDRTQVYEASRDELRALTDWRRAISGEASALAAQRGDPEQFKALVAAGNDYRDSVLPKSRRRMADTRFHILIAEIAGSRYLLEAERTIQELLTQVIMSLSEVEAVLPTLADSHDHLISAILSGDPEESRREMIDHAEWTYDWLSALLPTDFRLS